MQTPAEEGGVDWRRLASDRNVSLVVAKGLWEKARATAPHDPTQAGHAYHRMLEQAAGGNATHEPGRETLVDSKSGAHDAASLGPGKWTRSLLEGPKPAGPAKPGADGAKDKGADKDHDKAKANGASAATGGAPDNHKPQTPEQLRAEIVAAVEASKNAADLLTKSDPATIVAALRELQHGQPGILKKVMAVASSAIEHILGSKSGFEPKDKTETPKERTGFTVGHETHHIYVDEHGVVMMASDPKSVKERFETEWKPRLATMAPEAKARIEANIVRAEGIEAEVADLAKKAKAGDANAEKALPAKQAQLAAAIQGVDFQVLDPMETLKWPSYAQFKARFIKLAADLAMAGGDPEAQNLWLDTVKALQKTHPEYQVCLDPKTGYADLTSASYQKIMGDFDPIVTALTPYIEKFVQGKSEWAFWSGKAAKNAAIAHAQVCLESSPFGCLFDGININGSWDMQMWGALSRAYAAQAAAKVGAMKLSGFVGQGASRDMSIFNKIEQPHFAKMLAASATVSPHVTWYAVAGDPKKALGDLDQDFTGGGLAGTYKSGDRSSMIALTESENTRRLTLWTTKKEDEGPGGKIRNPPPAPAAAPPGAAAVGAHAPGAPAPAPGAAPTPAPAPAHVAPAPAAAPAPGAAPAAAAPAHAAPAPAPASTAPAAASPAAPAPAAKAPAPAPAPATAATPAAHAPGAAPAHPAASGPAAPAAPGAAPAPAPGAAPAHAAPTPAPAPAAAPAPAPTPAPAPAAAAPALAPKAAPALSGPASASVTPATPAPAPAAPAPAPQHGGKQANDARTDSQTAAGAQVDTKLQPTAHAGESVADAAKRLHPGERDSNFNPAEKVKFEAALAADILTHPAECAPALHAVSAKILVYIEAKAKAGLGEATADLKKLSNDAPWFGRFFESQIGLTDDQIAAGMRSVLKGAGTLPQQLAAHQTFFAQIFEKDWDKKIAQKFLDEGTKDPKFVRNAVRMKDGKLDPAGPSVFDKKTPGAVEERGRVARPGAPAPRPAAGGIADAKAGEHPAPIVPGGKTADGQDAGTEQSSQRGIDTFTMDESKAFCQRARIGLDMPLAAGVSGSTAELINCAMSLGLSGDLLDHYGLAVLGCISGGGNHSFLEIVTVLRAAGLHVNEETYDGAVPTLISAARMEALKAQFPNAFKTPQNAPGTPTPSDPHAAAQHVA